MEWWLWIVVGIVLLASEMIFPGGLFLLFFGFGGIIVGLSTVSGLTNTDWSQWTLFSLSSIALLMALRSKVQAVLGLKGASPEVDSMVGEAAVVTVAMAAGQLGKVELRGTTWSARNSGTGELSQGQRCIVESVDGLTLVVR